MIKQHMIKQKSSGYSLTADYKSAQERVEATGYKMP